MCQDTIEKTITIIPFAPYIVGDTVSCEGENNVLTIMDGTPIYGIREKQHFY